MRRRWMQPSLLAIVSVAVSAPSAQWVQPSQQITTGIYTLFAKDGELFAGTDGAGAFRSTDLGATWEPMNEGFPASQGVYAFREFGGRLFAGTYDGVYHSVDAGRHWIRSNHENWRVLHVVAMAGNGGFLFAPSNREFRYPYNGGIFRSADSGLTWTPVNNGFTATIWINTFAQHKNALYVGTSGEGVFRSADDGEAWAPFNRGLPAELSGIDTRCLYATGDKLYLGTSDGVYALAASGNSWTRSSRGMPDQTLITAIVAYGNHLFAGFSHTFGGGIYHSDDGGASWQLIDNPRGSEPPRVASLAVLGDQLFVGTGQSSCGELGCDGSIGSFWRLSIPRLLGVTATGPRDPRDGRTMWQRLAVPGRDIGFEIASRAYVTLEVHDAAGNRVTSLADRQFLPGRHSVPFAGEDLAKGPYFIRFRARSLDGNSVR